MRVPAMVIKHREIGSSLPEIVILVLTGNSILMNEEIQMRLLLI